MPTDGLRDHVTVPIIIANIMGTSPDVLKGILGRPEFWQVTSSGMLLSYVRADCGVIPIRVVRRKDSEFKNDNA